MKFDVVVGNPPYQEMTGGGTVIGSAKSIYQEFMLKTLDIARHQVFIVPAKWYASQGLSAVRQKILTDSLKELVDYVVASDCFSDVLLYSGICYYHIDKEYKGPTNYKQFSDSMISCKINFADYEHSIFIRNILGEHVIKKVIQSEANFMSEKKFTCKSFGIPTYTRGEETDTSMKNPFRLRTSAGFCYIDSPTIDLELASKYKIVTGYKMPGGNIKKFGAVGVINVPTILGPSEIFTDTYQVIATADNITEAKCLLSYFKTKFIRFLIQQTIATSTLSKYNFQFVPIPDKNIEYTDELLYKKYNITPEEIEYIENTIRDM